MVAFAKWNRTQSDGKLCWQLMVGLIGFERCAATVWDTGVWHTWDRDGTGGENGAEWKPRSGKPDVERAKIEAAAAAIEQGFV